MRKLLVLIAVLATACSTGVFYNPVLLSSGSARESSGDCPVGSTCVEFTLEGPENAAGKTGWCEIYTTPGDPDTMEPLVAEDVTVPDASTDDGPLPFLWEATIPSEVEPSGRNPVCGPMIEG